MFTITSSEDIEPEINTSEEEVTVETHTGGTSLLRTTKELLEVVVTSATVTIGSETPSEASNVHEQVVEALSGS